MEFKAMVAAVLISLVLSTTSWAQDVGRLVAESDQFFAALGEGKNTPDLEKTIVEQQRLRRIAATIEKQPPSLLQVKIQRRLGVIGSSLSGPDAEAADGHFKQAEEILEMLNGGGSVSAYQEKLATIWKERAENLIRLEQDDRALFFLDKALRAARASSYKDKLGEASIRELLAGVYFRAERFKDTLNVVNPAITIIDRLKDKPGFDVRAMRMPLWYQAVSTSRLGGDAEPFFDQYLRLFSSLTPHDEAEVYREAYRNVSERAVALGDGKIDALRKAHSYILKAWQIIQKSPSEEDIPEKVIVLTELGVSNARGGLTKEAESSFKAALAMGRKSITTGGKDSFLLVPALKLYAELLTRLGRNDEAQELISEKQRIEQLNKLNRRTTN